MKKNIYSYILYLCLALIFSACTMIDINQASTYASKRQYHYSLLQLDSYLKKGNEVDPKVLQKYEQFWNEGNRYYDAIIQQMGIADLKQISLAKERKLLMHRHFASLPETIKSKLSSNIYTPMNITKLQKEAVDSYISLGDLIGNSSYSKRLHQNYAYEKAMKYSPNPSLDLQQKWNFSKNNLERNIYVRWNGYTDSFFQNILVTKIQNLLIDSDLFILGRSQNAQIYFDVGIENYQFSNNPASLKTETKYKEISVSYQEEKIKVPYQELTFTKKWYLSYILRYQLVDKNGNIIFSGYKPCKNQEEKIWKQFVVLDSRYPLNLPRNEQEPQGKMEEEFITDSFISSLKEIQFKLNKLSNY